MRQKWTDADNARIFANICGYGDMRIDSHRCASGINSSMAIPIRYISIRSWPIDRTGSDKNIFDIIDLSKNRNTTKKLSAQYWDTEHGDKTGWRLEMPWRRTCHFSENRSQSDQTPPLYIWYGHHCFWRKIYWYAWHDRNNKTWCRVHTLGILSCFSVRRSH